MAVSGRDSVPKVRLAPTRGVPHKRWIACIDVPPDDKRSEQGDFDGHIKTTGRAAKTLRKLPCVRTTIKLTFGVRWVR
ncbi:MAG: hypothetical protein JWM95_530 [Gemmatimonadetes bacterium]|nr:hypothetical protein [Gemmatimonadota bacterium]